MKRILIIFSILLLVLCGCSAESNDVEKIEEYSLNSEWMNVIGETLTFLDNGTVIFSSIHSDDYDAAYYEVLDNSKIIFYIGDVTKTCTYSIENGVLTLQDNSPSPTLFYASIEKQQEIRNNIEKSKQNEQMEMKKYEEEQKRVEKVLKEYINLGFTPIYEDVIKDNEINILDIENNYSFKTISGKELKNLVYAYQDTPFTLILDIDDSIVIDSVISSDILLNYSDNVFRRIGNEGVDNLYVDFGVVLSQESHIEFPKKAWTVKWDYMKIDGDYELYFNQSLLILEKESPFYVEDSATYKLEPLYKEGIFTGLIAHRE